jgi:hypothetical protein
MMAWSWSTDELTRLGQALCDMNVCGPAVTARAVGDGHSNLTYLVSDGRRQVIVRRPPAPPVPPGAHDVVREARLVAALAETAVPVPRVFAIFAAGDMLDVPLVVTEYVDATVITDRTPPPLDTPAARREIALSAVDTLAALHGVDWQARGLADFGRPTGFNARHLNRVCRLVADPQGELPIPFRSVAERLRRRTPAESGVGIVHNDFRLGNLMAAKGPPGRVVAVLDWELATIGGSPVRSGLLPVYLPPARRATHPDHRDGYRGVGGRLSPSGRIGPQVLPANGGITGKRRLVLRAGAVQTRGPLRIRPSTRRILGR